MNSPTRTNAAPVLHWPAISSGALIGLAVSLVADALWSAAAFSSHNSAFGNRSGGEEDERPRREAVGGHGDEPRAVERAALLAAPSSVAAGGLLPRRAAASPGLTEAIARPAGLEAATNTRRPTGAVAS